MEIEKRVKALEDVVEYIINYIRQVKTISGDTSDDIYRYLEDKVWRKGDDYDKNQQMPLRRRS